MLRFGIQKEKHVRVAIEKNEHCFQNFFNGKFFLRCQRKCGTKALYKFCFKEPVLILYLYKEQVFIFNIHRKTYLTAGISKS